MRIKEKDTFVAGEGTTGWQTMCVTIQFGHTISLYGMEVLSLRARVTLSSRVTIWQTDEVAAAVVWVRYPRPGGQE